MISSALGDFDGDGRQDLAFAGQWPTCNNADDDTPIAIWNGRTTQASEVDFVHGTLGWAGLVSHDAMCFAGEHTPLTLARAAGETAIVEMLEAAVEQVKTDST